MWAQKKQGKMTFPCIYSTREQITKPMNFSVLIFPTVPKGE